MYFNTEILKKKVEQPGQNNKAIFDPDEVIIIKIKS